MSKKPLNKRKPKKELKGLGDAIEVVTKATGIKKVFDSLGVDCGCDERKAKLNKMFKFKTSPLCLAESEYNSLKNFFNEFNGVQLTDEQQTLVATIHARAFQHRFYKPCTCSPRTWMEYVDDLKKLYKEY